MGIMCKVMRGEFIESMHVAYAVVVDNAGKIVRYWGDAHYLTCVRSTLKPFQAGSVVKAGATVAAGFNDAELALMCASHNGEEIHVKTGQGMLDKLGVDISTLVCGSHAPYEKEAKLNLIRAGKTPTILHNNCSGKHAGMLALAKHMGIDPTEYTALEHPVQQAILKQVKAYSELDKLPVAIDGCSAPTPFMPLYNIALMFQKFTTGNHEELQALFAAMTSYAYLVAGKGRFDTDFISALGGRAVTKAGGEAVRGLGIRNRDGEVFGLALKVLDGNKRCAPNVMMAILAEMDLLFDDELENLKQYRYTILRNHRKLDVGAIAIDML